MDNQKMNNNRPDQDPEGGNNKKDDMNKKSLLVMVVLAIAVMIIAQMLSGKIASASQKEVTYTEFMQDVKDGKVTKVELDSDRIYYEVKNQKNVKYYTGNVQDERLYEELDNAGVTYSRKVIDTTTYVMSSILSFVLPTVLMVAVMMIFYRFAFKGGGGVMGVGKSNAKLYVQDKTGVTFQDVAGQEESKESLREIVDFLHNPEKYTKIGAKLPKGALLVGPPGTGKTLLAKAVAGEAGVPFFSLSGSDFVEMFVGVGASRVRDLFKQAQQNAPCIIFIDELDAIGKSRDSRFGGNDEREQTLNQLLAEMDGFDSSKGIIILAATNRPEILDKALLRPGRFDRRIIVERPDLKGRIDVLKVHAKNVCMDETVDFKEIALATSGAVGSDLANIINEAALLAVRNGRNAVSQSDLFESVEVVIAGKAKKDRVLSAEERRIVSYHEVGHALVAALQKNTEPVQKITIIPRTMGALGYVMQVPEEEKYLMSEKQIREELVTMLAGRAAESIVFDSVTTGASNDIEQATKLARAMITQYGMSEKFGLIGLTTVEDQYLGGRATLNCGEATAAEIDQEVMKILKAAYDQALALLADNRDCLDKIAAFLIERETITGKEFMKIFREVKGIPDSETEQAEANVSNPAKNDSQPDGQDEPTLVEAKTDNGASSESDINVSLETKAED
ncbi:ATP-dependent zinc metalloprotease FtsH [Agathobaculum butyriciproducens]|jgi:cell division protease FtsH|uniref:ATP-dependent zinc metalloprotease FtsH n=1 Tax=Coprococcus catus TaxID=116085 RepID=UPI00210AF973|nr:ATP-dependent zinc metalloprotease FtsH [Coprococcus catus]MCQ5054463.1 ATP-dependent zinc metalloprotease FtsH [Agathobaculum butyriciproducens]